MGWFGKERGGEPTSSAEQNAVSGEINEKKSLMEMGAEKRKSRAEARSRFWGGLKKRAAGFRGKLKSGWDTMVTIANIPKVEAAKRGVDAVAEKAVDLKDSALDAGERALDATGRGLETAGRAVSRTAQEGVEWGVVGVLKVGMAIDSGVRGAAKYTADAFTENWDMIKEGASEAKKNILEGAANKWDSLVSKKDVAVERAVAGKDAVVDKFNTWRMERAAKKARKEQESYKKALSRLEALGGTISML